MYKILYFSFALKISFATTIVVMNWGDESFRYYSYSSGNTVKLPKSNEYVYMYKAWVSDDFYVSCM